MLDVGCGNTESEFEGCHSDQQICSCKMNSLALKITIEMPGAKREGNRDGMNR